MQFIHDVRPSIFIWMSPFDNDPKKDEDGNEIEPIRSKDEPYKNIGISRFYELFDEIIDFYVAKRPDKRDHYDLLKENREKVFIQSIPVYTIHLRPYKLEAGEA